MTCFAFLSLTTPLMLGGLAALALPIAAHLLYRHSRRKIVFPTIRLLQATVASQSQWFRMRRWILLALRCLALALLVAAFARPVWLDAKTAKDSTGKGAGVVLLVDTSASTGQESDGVSLIRGLQGAAGRTLDSLLSGTDLANVVTVSAQPSALFPRLSPNLPAIREELKNLSATYERGDFPKGLALAGEFLRGHAGERRLVVLSDLQQTNWDVVTHTDLMKLIPADTQVTFVQLDAAVPDNIALAGARSFPLQPLAKRPMQLVVHARNFSEREKQVRLEIALDGQPLPPQTLVLAGGEQRDVTLETTLTAPGEHTVEFSIPADGLAADNRAYLVVKAVQRLPVLIVSDEDPNEPGSATYFLHRAWPRAGDDTDRYEVRFVTSAAAAQGDWSEAAAVFVTYLGELPPAAAQQMLRYVEQGGGLAFFCGEGAVDRLLAVLEGLHADGVLPWKPGPVRVLADLDDALHVTGGKWQSRLLRKFDEQSQLAFAQIRFQRVWTAGAIKPDAQVLLTFSDQTPALASRPVGAGQMVVANFSPGLDSSDLGKYGSFVALVQALAKELRPARDRSVPAIVGLPYRHPASFAVDPQGQQLEILGPDGKGALGISHLLSQRASSPINLEAGKLTIHLEHPRQPGFYRIQRGSQVFATAALNVDPRESDLERMDRKLLAAHFAKGGVEVAVEAMDDWEPVLNMRGRPLWGWCLTLALLAVGVELFFLGLWRR